MAVKIRLLRQGSKKRPVYQIVAIDSQDRRDGQPLERLGQYFPKAELPADKVKVKKEAVEAWIAKGAQMSETVGQLLKIASK
ncbi:MAG: 30S ribosomal protein S16 [Bdellovibrionaceae bacterium]|nr:30S ribosomal protein S16 [Pseudobdellovibrionaceae bacterium]